MFLNPQHLLEVFVTQTARLQLLYKALQELHTYRLLVLLWSRALVRTINDLIFPFSSSSKTPLAVGDSSSEASVSLPLRFFAVFGCLSQTTQSMVCFFIQAEAFFFGWDRLRKEYFLNLLSIAAWSTGPNLGFRWEVISIGHWMNARALCRLQNSRIFCERERRTIFEQKARASEKTARACEARELHTRGLHLRRFQPSENDCFAV